MASEGLKNLPNRSGRSGPRLPASDREQVDSICVEVPVFRSRRKEIPWMKTSVLPGAEALRAGLLHGGQPRSRKAYAGMSSARTVEPQRGREARGSPGKDLEAAGGGDDGLAGDRTANPGLEPARITAIATAYGIGLPALEPTFRVPKRARGCRPASYELGRPPSPSSWVAFFFFRNRRNSITRWFWVRGVRTERRELPFRLGSSRDRKSSWPVSGLGGWLGGNAPDARDGWRRSALGAAPLPRGRDRHRPALGLVHLLHAPRSSSRSPR
jgi:hypothetical protein